MIYDSYIATNEKGLKWTGWVGALHSDLYPLKNCRDEGERGCKKELGVA